MVSKFPSRHAHYLISKKRSVITNRKYRPSERDVRYWWGVVNSALFIDQAVKRPQHVYVKIRRQTWAMTYSYDNRPKCSIAVNRTFRSFTHFITVLVHEMVHVWEHENYGDMSHGSDFYSWEVEVRERVGVELSEYVL
jgi:hypothetical protein